MNRVSLQVWIRSVALASAVTLALALPLGSVTTAVAASGSTDPTMATLDGKVTNQKGDVIKGAAVAAQDASQKQYTATTDANGAFSLDQLPAGTMSVTITADGYKNLTRKSVTLKAGKTTKLSLKLTAATGTLQGKLVELGTSQPVAGAAVAVAGTTVQVQSTAEGSFTIENIADGTITINITANGYKPMTHKLRIHGGHTASHTFKLTSTMGVLAGTVTDKSDKPLAAATITVSGGGLTFTGKSSTDGSFSLPKIPEGTYDVLVTANGFKAVEHKAVKIHGSRTHKLKVRMAPDTATLVGKVTNAGGQAIAGAKITLTAGQQTYSATSGADGGYRIEGVADGTYQATVTADKFKNLEHKNLRLHGGRSHTLNFKLKAQ